MMMRFNIVPILISSLYFVYVMTSSSGDVVLVNAFGVLSINRSNKKSTTQMMMIDEGSEDVSTTTRKNFLIAAFAGGMTVATVVAPPDAAWAAKEISAIQKRDNYLSTFVYECTKPKGEEQKSRVECISEGKAAYKESLKPKVVVVEPEAAAAAPEAPTQPASSE